MNMVSYRLVSLTFCVLLCTQAYCWKPAGNHIRTPWAEDLNPENVLPEYPRPQMVRPAWQNLNGLWNYSITPGKAAEPSVEPQGEILVPFAIESSLSGVGKTLAKDEVLWYERKFNIPSQWKGKHVLLHFGAVDWQTDVWLNNQKVGSHTGGYSPFEFDITSFLTKGEQTLRIRVLDNTDLTWQPRGKQVTRPSGIWYTSVSGIWQTVWLEPVEKTYIRDYYAVSDIDAGTLSVEVTTEELQQGDRIQVDLLEGGMAYNPQEPLDKVLATGDATSGQTCLEVPNPCTWSPDSPYLYGLRIQIFRGKKVIDTVNGYTALRKISRKNCKNADGKSHWRMALNNKALFQIGPLDQGWWPDGLYTAPSDEALRFDIMKTKQWGFNMIRKHIKVEPARWFYWCDVMGILVWQDMPCIGDHSYFRHHKGNGERDEGLRTKMSNIWQTDNPLGGTDCQVPQEWKENYYREWRDIILATRCFQCIAVWVPFNEGWGQFDTRRAVEFTRSIDPTRLVNEASGGNYRYAGDILDVHHYPTPAMHAYDMNNINVLGEFGGIGMPEEGHLWQQGDNWGYNGVKKSHEEVTDTYIDFAGMLRTLIRTGCSAAVYTQTTDVEGEVNGILTYDRKVVKMDEQKLNQTNRSLIHSMEE